MAHLTLIILALAALLTIIGSVLAVQSERPTLRPLGLIVAILSLVAIPAILLAK
ncbi:MAG: hypothetical protein AAFY65_07565 [Pseudomonadota bacterium]